MTYIHEVECQMRALNVCSELSGPLKDPNVNLKLISKWSCRSPKPVWFMPWQRDFADQLLKDFLNFKVGFLSAKSR